MKSINVNHVDDNFCCTLLIVISLTFFISYFLIEYWTIDASGITPNSDTKSSTPIKHVIVISQGKRSFDNYFGTFPGANGLPRNLTIPFNPFPPPLLKFTIATWFNTNKTFSTNGFLVNKGGVGSDIEGYNMNYGIWMNGNGNIMAGFETKKGKDHIVGSNQKYNDGKWHQVVVTYDGNSNLLLFIDGNQTASNQTGGESPDTTGTKPIRIGSNSFQPENFFTGFIDEVRIWNRTLDYSEILNGFNNNSYNPDKQIVYTSFEDRENYVSNATSEHGGLQLKGIYLNGSIYHDLKINISKYTSYLKPYHLTKTKTDNPNHGQNAYDISYNNGQMNGFVFSQFLDGKDPRLAMGYYNGTNLPYYWKFASEFVLADNFFASTMDTGFDNENYLYTGTPIDNRKNISFRDLNNLNRTIFDELQKSGVSWRIYVEDYNPALNHTENALKKNRFINLLTETQRFQNNKTLNSNIVDLVQYFRDLRSDNFPAVAYIVAPNAEDSSPRDVYVGQEFAASLVLALMKSKHWNDSALILTYRESGGWYDHVPPPIIDSQTYGFRVPALIISPYAKKGYVDNTLYDAASILKFIEYNYDIAPIAERDASANNMIQAFDFTKPPREPLILKSSYIQNSSQEIKKNMDKSKSVTTVNLVYLTILPTIAIIGLIICWMVYRKQTKSDLIQGN